MNNHSGLTGLIGSANEVSVWVEGIETKSLIDTGSTISTISQSFYKKYFDFLDIKPLLSLLNIECADGQLLPYEGYIELNLEVDGLPKSGNRMSDCIFLVVPDSNYNSTVPLLIGTNILVPLMEITRENSGEHFLQSADLHTPLYLAFRCLLLRDKELERRKDRIAVIKSAESGPVTIKPNSDITIQGYLDKEVPYHPVCCMIHPTKGAAIPDDVDITPTLVPYNHGGGQKVCIQLTNISTRTVTVQPKALICELQPIDIEDIHQVDTESSSDDMSDQVNICTESLTPHELDKAQKKQKRHYDLKVRGAFLRQGDRVLVKILAFDGKHKLSDKWEEEAYVVLSQPNSGIPVYKPCVTHGSDSEARE
ncbi:hypothetical protein ScPMuIL_011228 [Solemya velum]